MDDLITLFVTSNYTEEAQEDIFQALGLFRVFNHLEPFKVIDDILMMESYIDSSTAVDDVTSQILIGQAYLLDRHGISLSEDTTLAFNNIVLRGLFQLQHLEDPTSVLRILETMENREYKIATILEELTNVPSITFLQMLDEVRPICTDLLSEFLYMQEDNKKESGVIIPEIVEKVKLFKEVLGINQAVRVILDSDTVMGEEFKLYMPLFDELREVVTDENVLVETLLFLLLYSRDGVNNPVSVFEQYSDHLVSDLTMSSRLGNTLASLYMKLQRHKETLKNETE